MPLIDNSSILIDSIPLVEQGSTPSTPLAGKSAIFAKADGLYIVDDSGTVTGPLRASVTPGAKVYNNANISLSNGVGANLTFNSEFFDTDGFHSVSSNTDRLTCPITGVYLITACVEFASNAAGQRTIYITRGESDYQAVTDAWPVNGKTTSMNLAIVLHMTAGDYVTLSAVQNSGGNLNVIYSANYSPVFSMQRIG
jgi:hypothetical protein